MSLLQSNDFKDVVANDGRIVPPSSNLYKQLSVALDRTISPKYIYTILKLNRYNVYKDLLFTRNIEVQNDSDITETTIDTLNNSRTISFVIDITDIWPQISDEKVKYNLKHRKRNVRAITHGQAYFTSDYTMKLNYRVHLLSNVQKYQKVESF